MTSGPARIGERPRADGLADVGVAALAEADLRLVQASTPDGLLQTATDSLVQMLAVDRAFFRDQKQGFSWVSAISCAPGVPDIKIGLGSSRPPLDMAVVVAAGQVVVHDLESPDPLSDSLILHREALTHGFGIRALALQVVKSRELFGVLSLHSLQPRRWGAHEALVVEHVASLVGLAYDRLILIEELKRTSRRDELTGLWNRRAFSRDLDRELARSRRYGRSLSILLFDLDGLKAVNDTKGHQAGDKALRRFAKWLTVQMRHADCLYRWGGDEFVLMLPETTEEAAKFLCDRLQAASTHDNVHRCSIGWAAAPEDGTTPETLIGAADKRLYEAKYTAQRNGSANGN